MSSMNFQVITDGRHRGVKLLATRPFAKGDVLDHFADAQILPNRTYQTVQISIHDHVLVNETLAKLNHSCRPTTFVDTVRRVIIAERVIATGEELTFFYPATEWEMAEPFFCNCGYPECVGLVSGAKFLPSGRLAQYTYNPHIIALFDAQDRHRTVHTDRFLQPA